MLYVAKGKRSASKSPHKTGVSTLIVSRPVGNSCPQDCFFLGNGCYAERIESYRPGVRNSALPNMDATVEDWIALFERAEGDRNPVRLWERGDYGRNGRVDVKAINRIRKAISIVGPTIPVWSYTHFIRSKSIASLWRVGIVSFASIHSEREMITAKAAGFRNLALALPVTWKQYQKRSLCADNRSPNWIRFGGEWFLACPEQRIGARVIPCDVCRYCFYVDKNVAFFKH